MSWKMVSGGGLLLLAGAVVFVTPGAGQAQHGGGSHFAGGHFGGPAFGGSHIGGAHFDGYGRGYPPAYYRPSHRYHPYGRYGLYPYYYGTYPYAHGASPYLWSDTDYGPGYSGFYGSELPPSPETGTFFSPLATGHPSYDALGSDTAPAQTDQTARVTVSVPPSAAVWFEGVKTTSTGSIREYQSPPLTPGNPYTYEIRARWSENGREVTQTQTVQVIAGGHITVSFPVSPTTERPAAAGG